MNVAQKTGTRSSMETQAERLKFLKTLLFRQADQAGSFYQETIRAAEISVKTYRILREFSEK